MSEYHGLYWDDDEEQTEEDKTVKIALDSIEEAKKEAAKVAKKAADKLRYELMLLGRPLK